MNALVPLPVEVAPISNLSHAELAKRIVVLLRACVLLAFAGAGWRRREPSGADRVAGLRSGHPRFPTRAASAALFAARAVDAGHGVTRGVVLTYWK